MSFGTAIVVGASSGIGAEIVRQLAQGGATVAAVARRGPLLKQLAAENPKIKVYSHDVLDYAATPALFDRIVADLGGLDLIIYNAGVMPTVEESEYSFSKDRQMLEVNLVAAVCWLDLAAAYLEPLRKGTILGVSSVAGERGRRGAPVYTASKAGLTAYLEALRNRLHRYGVHVVTAKPGPVKTDMTAGMKLPFMIDAPEAARGILELAEAGTGEGFVPKIWSPIMGVIRNVPSPIFRKTNI